MRFFRLGRASACYWTCFEKAPRPKQIPPYSRGLHDAACARKKRVRNMPRSDRKIFWKEKKGLTASIPAPTKDCAKNIARKKKRANSRPIMSTTSRKGLVYNLTGRPLRARRPTHPTGVSSDATQNLISFGLCAPVDALLFDDMHQSGPDGGERDPFPDALLPRSAQCIGCGADLGEANARQYCAKTHCPFYC